MNKFTLQSIGALILSFLLIFSVACTSGEKKEKSTAKEGKTVELTISAAASLQDALKEIETKYKEKEPNIKLSFNFGASGALQQQIEQGAPADLFFSAAEDKFQTLVKKGFINEQEGKNLLGNELVLVVPKDSSLTKIQDLKDEKIKKSHLVHLNLYLRENTQKLLSHMKIFGMTFKIKSYLQKMFAKC